MAKQDQAEIEKQEIDQLVQQYLEKGGEVTVCEKFARSEHIEYTVGWGKKRKTMKK